MTFEDFLELVPLELGEYLIPSTRVLLLRRTSKKILEIVKRMQCRVDVEPGKTVRRMYANEAGAYTQRRAAVNLFLGRSLQMCITQFPIRSFTLHGMCIDQTGSLNAMLRNSRRMEVLDLYNNHIPDDAIGEVFEAIPASVRVLKLTRQWINRAAVTPLCALLARLTVLAELDLSENYLNSQGMQALMTSITSTELRRVSLRFNHLRSRFWDEYPQLGLDRFVLEELDLSHNLLQAVFGDSIHACIRGSTGKLWKLDVSFNDLRLAGVSYLTTALRHCYALRHLNIAGNLCGDAAIALLLAVINPHMSCESCIALESLNVAHNSLTCASARLFHRSLFGSDKLRRSLTSVSFSNNDLHDTGAMLVIEALLPCDMRNLALAHCLIGETTGLCLAGTMLHWPMLAELDVHGNYLCGTSLLLMARAMSENNSDSKSMLFIGNWVLQAANQEIADILGSTRAHKSTKSIISAPHTTPASVRA
jgi:Ran GTPase-activating protein (RanGAP) involved in mRNA processing and transport